jgi:hypothetical protein
MLAEFARSLFLRQMKHTNKQDRMHVLHKGLRITLKYTSLKQHPTPNPPPPQKKRQKTKKQTPHPKIFICIIKKFLFFNFVISNNLAKFSRN